MIRSRFARSIGLAGAMVVVAVVGAERSTLAQPIDSEQLPAGLADCRVIALSDGIKCRR